MIIFILNIKNLCNKIIQIYQNFVEEVPTCNLQKTICVLDLPGTVLGVLLRYQREGTLCCCWRHQEDTRLKFPNNHADFLRLFWLDENCCITDYRLLVHVFGEISTSSIANFALKNSFNYTNCDDETKFPTHNNFYVDDFLK